MSRTVQSTSKKKKKYKLKGVYKDMRLVFGQQLIAFTQQFIASADDIEAFLVDADNNQEWLDQMVGDWCETEETTVADDLNVATAIFIMALLDKVDELTAPEEGSEDDPPFVSK